MSGVHTTRAFRPVPDFPKDDKGNDMYFQSTAKNFAADAQRVREDFIAIEHANILRRRLIRCFREEGVNHYENCKDLVDQYYERVHAPMHGALYKTSSSE